MHTELNIQQFFFRKKKKDLIIVLMGLLDSVLLPALASLEYFQRDFPLKGR